MVFCHFVNIGEYGENPVDSKKNGEENSFVEHFPTADCATQKNVMKQPVLITSVLILILMAGKLPAQENDSITYQRDHDHLAQAGLSFGYFGSGYTGTRTGLTVPLSFSYETYFTDHISGGGFLGYASYKYEGVNDDTYGWTFFDFGARASYHFIHLLNEHTEANIDPEKFDFYVTAMLIFETRSFSSDGGYYDDYYENDFNLIFGPVAGFRYKFSDRFSAYFEGGRGTFGFGTLGITMMF